MLTTCHSLSSKCLHPIPQGTIYTDLAGRLYCRCWSALRLYTLPRVSYAVSSFRFTTCEFLMVGGLNSQPLASSVSTRSDANAVNSGGQGAYTPSSVFCSGPRDANQCAQPANALVRRPCTQIRGSRLCRPCHCVELMQPLLECVAAVHPAAIFFCTDAAGQSFLSCCHRLYQQRSTLLQPLLL